MQSDVETGEILFSISNYGVFDIYQWWMFLIFYGIAALLLIPATSRIWPIRNFSFFKTNPTKSAIVLFVFVTLIAVPHYLWCATALAADKRALATNEYEKVVGCYMRPSPENENFLHAQRSSLKIIISGRTLSPPVGGYALYILDEIRSLLPRDEPIVAFVRDGALIEARELLHGNETDCAQFLPTPSSRP